MAAKDLQSGVEFTEASGVSHGCPSPLVGVSGNKLSVDLLKRELLRINRSDDSVGRVVEISIKSEMSNKAKSNEFHSPTHMTIINLLLIYVHCACMCEISNVQLNF